MELQILNQKNIMFYILEHVKWQSFTILPNNSTNAKKNSDERNKQTCTGR